MYDQTDEKTDQLFGSVVELLRNVPDRLARQALAKLFEDAAVLEVLIRKNNLEAGPGEAQEALSNHWDDIESIRNERAADFLYSIQTQEY